MPRFLPAVLAALFLLGALPATARADDAEQAALQKMVDELRPVVAKLRGLEWKHDVPAAVMSRDELIAFMLEKLDEDFPPEKRELAVRIVRRHHLLRPDEDPLALELEMMKEMVAGFYDPDTKRFYVIEGMVGEAQKPTIVHELLHALEDQHFDLEAIEKPFRENDPDRVFAIRCMWEGSAEWIRRRYQQQDPATDAEYYRQQMNDTSDRGAVQTRILTELVPAYMVLDTLLHYRVGPNFVLNAVGDDLYGGMKRLIADPPTTQEQVLHPYRWLGPNRDYPRKIHWDPAFRPETAKYGTILHVSTVGELDLATYLDYFLGDNNGRLTEEAHGSGRFVSEDVQEAAHGWDAGQSVHLEAPDGRIIVAQALAFDSEEDAEVAAMAIERALRVAYQDSLTAGDWDALPEHPAAASWLYASEHGVGRLVTRGHEVLWLDGVTAAEHDELMPALLATRFEKDPRDKGDVTDAEDPFAGCAIVSRGRGLGIVLPDEAWSASDGEDAASLAVVQRPGLQVEVRVIDQEFTPEGLRLILQPSLGPVFRPGSITPVSNQRGVGIKHPLPAGPIYAIYAISDAARTYVAVVQADREADAAAIDAEVLKLLDGVVSVPSY